ncbi:DUF1624 domain-containing protein [Hylemonella sp. W303a]|uniref:DUF1624 domain-containing protein n=1 Tax=Hylemonella sp. W303a TaxID=3389873 RepID=UPI00396B22F9
MSFPSRLASIDALRGAVMVLMLVDHAREFFFLHRQVADPMLVEATSPDLFFTRLLSHFCAPIFVLLTGLGAWLHAHRPGVGPAQTSAYLFKRGLLLIVLELTLVGFAWSFEFPPRVVYLQVIWAIGLSMLALAVLLHLPLSVQLGLGLLIVFGHNLLDGVHFQPGEPAYLAWAVLHDRGWIELSEGLRARTSYPVLPWIGVILLGYQLGRLYQPEQPARRRGLLLGLGLACLGLFLVLRCTHGYGDHDWTPAASALQTVMAFLNVTKYPPSLQFLLLTLGAGFIALAWLERVRPWPALVVLGSAPMFFYLLHLYVLHVFYLLLAPAQQLPSAQRWGVDAVWQLWVISALVLALVYGPCRWYARFKRTTTVAVFRYL